jgi:hypothetical protein
LKASVVVYTHHNQNQIRSCHTPKSQSSREQLSIRKYVLPLHLGRVNMCKRISGPFHVRSLCLSSILSPNHKECRSETVAPDSDPCNDPLPANIFAMPVCSSAQSLAKKQNILQLQFTNQNPMCSSHLTYKRGLG